MSGGAKTYWEKSCPECGKPSIENGRNALNKVNPNKLSRKVKCVVCGVFLYPQFENEGIE